MKKILTLLLFLSACNPLPPHETIYALPLELGSPPRQLDPTMRITILEVDPSTLIANHRYAGAAIMDNECIILLPKGSPNYIREKLLAHEIRHCAGQSHTVTYNEAGRPIDHWTP